MNQESEGLRIARERIALEAEARTGFLDLGCLGLTALPEALFELQHLRSLNLGRHYLDQDGESKWVAGSGAANAVQDDLQQLSRLPKLEALFLNEAQINDLTGLSALKNLQKLFCVDTQIDNLTPLQGLSALQELDYSHTQVNDLTPLQGLSALQDLNCVDTQVNDLTPLQGLSVLWRLDCFAVRKSMI